MAEKKRPSIARPMSPEELRAFREKYGLTQEELAKILGITRTALSHWETGKRKIPPYLYELLSCLKEKNLL